MLIAYAAEDDARLAHRLAPPTSGRPGRPAPRRVTACGLAVVDVRQGVPRHNSGCHVCVPFRVHPLAAVWAECRRLDRNANAATGAQPW